MSKRAVILAGGKGTRLRPYTVVLPKPLMPIGEFPIIEVIIRQLIQHGFDHVTLAVNHQAEIIKAFFSDTSRFDIKIDYSLETTPLGTMGPLQNIDDLPENFLVMNGDILTDLDYTGFHDTHAGNKEIFSISSHNRVQKIDYGTLEFSNDGYLTDFKEKPKLSYQVSMGIYMLNRSVLEYIPEGKQYGFDQLMLDLMSSGKQPKVQQFDGYWLDIGRPDDYMLAIEEFEQMKERFIPN